MVINFTLDRMGMFLSDYESEKKGEKFCFSQFVYPFHAEFYLEKVYSLLICSIKGRLYKTCIKKGLS
jgi:hypothetical protein